MALVLVFSLVGCSTVEDDYSSVEYVYQDNYIEQDNNSGDTDPDKNPDNTTSNTTPDDTTSKEPDEDNSSTTDPAPGVDLEKLKGSTVVFATTILSKQDESGPVVDAFEKKYGIEVKEILVKDNVNDIAGKIASNTNIDVMRSNGDFPAAMAVLQSLTAAKLDMTDPIWDKSMFEFTTFGGEPYLCNTVGNIWAENYCVIYSKSLLKRANATTPEEYDAAGNWTIDAFAEIAKKVESIDDIGTGIRGSYIQGEEFLGSIGCALYKYDNGKFTSGLKDPKMAEAMAKLASWRKEGFMTDSAIDPFNKGNVGIVYGLAGWSLKKNGSNEGINWNDVGYYKMPAYTKGATVMNTSMVKGWGIVRGSKNPVGGGVFLRYYLDAGNYNFDNAFGTSDAAKFFLSNTSNLSMNNFTPIFTYSQGTEKLTSFREWDWESIAHGDPAQVTKELNSISAAVDKAVDVMNKHVTKNTGRK